MVSKADFTAEDWQQITTTPLMAALYITFASPSGPVGAVKEMMVFPKLILEGIKTASGNALIDAVVADFKEKMDKKERPEMPQMGKKPEEIELTEKVRPIWVRTFSHKNGIIYTDKASKIKGLRGLC